jgi:hypothetical protein
VGALEGSKGAVFPYSAASPQTFAANPPKLLGVVLASRHGLHVGMTELEKARLFGVRFALSKPLAKSGSQRG